MMEKTERDWRQDAQDWIYAADPWDMANSTQGIQDAYQLLTSAVVEALKSGEEDL